MEESVASRKIEERKKTRSQLHGRPDYYYHEGKRIWISGNTYALPPAQPSSIENRATIVEWLDSTVNSP
jgi:hypothetical protein